MAVSLSDEMQRAFLSPLFLGGVAVAFTGILFSGAFDLSISEVSRMDALSVFRYAYCFNNSFWFVVVGAALPYAGSFCEDYSSGRLCLLLVRERRWRYLSEKFVACVVSGGAVVVLSCSLFLVLCTALCPELVSVETGEWQYLAGHEPFIEVLLEGNAILYWVLFCCAQFCYGAFWAALGFTVSLFALYRYAAYAAPFIGAIALVQIIHFGAWPVQLNLASLAYSQSFGGTTQTMLVIAGVYGLAMLLMLAACYGRLRTVMAHE